MKKYEISMTLIVKKIGLLDGIIARQPVFARETKNYLFINLNGVERKFKKRQTVGTDGCATFAEIGSMDHCRGYETYLFR